MPRVLSIHASYRCRDAGICCTSGWSIGIERAEFEIARTAMADGRLLTTRPCATPFTVVADDDVDAAAVLATSEGACVFHGGAGTRGCGIQRALGHSALPLACRQFPRVTVRDPRGPSITLSHYCPTAASLLGGGGSLTIVSDPPDFPRDGEYVGLDATTSLPPRLRPDMLMDWESWWTWERVAVAALAQAPTPREGLARLRAAVAHARDWRPANGPLGARVEEAFATPAESAGVAEDDDAMARLIDQIRRAIPAALRPRAAAAPRPAGLSSRAHAHFLAAHAFASWTAHLGQGLRAWLRSIEAAHALVARGASAGEADLWLRHLADPFVLAERWSEEE